MASPDDSDESLKECPICGSDVESDADYCTECGNDFNADNTYSY